MKSVAVKALLTLSVLLVVLAGRYWNPAVTTAEPPSSARSRQAIARVRPVLETALASKGLQYGNPVFLRIFKASKELEVWLAADDSFRLFKTYEICSFSGQLGPKLRVGDLQSPEGFYFVTPARLNPYSQFHLSFDLCYPNAYDRAHGRTGSALMVHGNCVSIGCYAMTDTGISEIYALVDAALRGGQPFFRVHIFPFRMSPENLQRHEDSRWRDFWANLQQGYDFFEQERRPPNVEVRERRYVFGDS
jgi:murein L,D-transpeptidase YafK